MNLEYWRNWIDEIEAAPLDALLAGASAPVRAALERAIEGRELTLDEGLALYTSQGDDLRAMVKCADLARAQDVGDEVTYVVNRNLNFTNICFVGCQFCGFKRQRWESDAYDHSDQAILAKVADAVARGAIGSLHAGRNQCRDAGVQVSRPARRHQGRLPADPHPCVLARWRSCTARGARGWSIPEYIAMLREHGLGSIPGTAAEILDDSVREILSHKKVDVAAWVDIITTAHSLGVPTTSTVMYGHIETPRHVVNHLDLMRTIQKETHGFTEFVPLRFIHHNTVMYRKGLVKPQDNGPLDFQMYAFARLFLRAQIKNLQTSWVKLGVDLAALTLKAGCNDFSGTLMEESITAQAGGEAGEFVPVDLIEDKVREMGRTPVERTTLYKKLYGRKAPNGARPILPSSQPADNHACGGSGCS